MDRVFMLVAFVTVAASAALPAGEVTNLAGDPRRIDDPETADTGLGACPIVDMGAFEYEQGSTECCPRVGRPECAERRCARGARHGHETRARGTAEFTTSGGTGDGGRHPWGIERLRPIAAGSAERACARDATQPGTMHASP